MKALKECENKNLTYVNKDHDKFALLIVLRFLRNLQCLRSRLIILRSQVPYHIPGYPSAGVLLFWYISKWQFNHVNLSSLLEIFFDF